MAKINRSEKQQMSIILRSQLVNDFKAKRYNNGDHSILYQLKNSGYRVNHSLSGWSSDNFRFRFQYGKRGAVRVAYMNSDGIQSATFNSDEWQLILEDTAAIICEAYADGLVAQEEKQRKEREERRFKRAVKDAVREILEERNRMSAVSKGDIANME